MEGSGERGDLPVRSVVVWCLDWPVVALRVDPGDPVAVVHANRVVACTPAALAYGVQRGLRRRESQRRCSTLRVLDRDETVEARAFEAVAVALDELTPRVEIVRPGMVVFPSRGPSRYFGGDEAMAAHGVGLVREVLSNLGVVRLGVADGAFGAAMAARQASDNGVRVVEPQGSRAFLAPFPVRALDRRDLTSMLERLGLTTLGLFAELDRSDVVGRFGSDGAVAHRLACGLDERPPALIEPPPNMEVVADLDPPIERVDQASFMGKVLADQLLARLEERSATCTRVVISATTEQGDELTRCWRHEGALSAAAIADRVRWQLDSWIGSSARKRPGAGLVRLSVRPDDIVAAAGRQMGFWGGPSESIDRVERTVARVQAMLGAGAVRVPELGGGRSPNEQIVTVAADTVELDRSSVQGSRQTTFVSLANTRSSAPWPGQLPTPSPAKVFVIRPDAEVIDERGEPVEVDARALLSANPYQARLGLDRWLEIVSWAGPWPIDERWWDSQRARRRARLQVVTDDGNAHVLVIEGGRWWVEATYD